MREIFIGRTFHSKTKRIIRIANHILDEYRERGYVLTLRQLYYQFVHRKIIENDQKEYKRLGSIINDARLAGLIDWDMIEDRTRNLKTHASWEGPQNILNSAAQEFRLNPWGKQTYQPEVWIEKEALVGVIERICIEYRIPYFACRGYTSQSEQYIAGKRLASYYDNNQIPVIIHLSDHDPSGVNMTEDNTSRLEMFAEIGKVDFRRIALNMDQIQEYELPPDPAKDTDKRHAKYVEQYGDGSWELDALDPGVIEELIR